MELDAPVEIRIDNWLERNTSEEADTKRAIPRVRVNIQRKVLAGDHPLRHELKKKASESVEDWKSRRCTGWEQLVNDSTRTNPQGGSRQMVVGTKDIMDVEGNQGNSVLDHYDFAAELKKATLRWSIYKFPLRHTLTGDERKILHKLPKWPQLLIQENAEVRNALFVTYNAEKLMWNMRTNATRGAKEISSSTRSA